MAKYAILYDLRKPGQDYADLIAKIESTWGTRWHAQGSVWIIQTTMTAQQVYDKLSPFIDVNDELIVVELGRSAAWYGYSERANQWFKDVLNAA